MIFGYSKKFVIGAAALLFGAVVLGVAVFGGDEKEEAAARQAVREVEVRSVRELAHGGSSLSVTGSVESRSEALVRAEVPGEIAAVYRQLGDVVPAGAVLAEQKNTLQRAQLLQAQGQLQAAQANLAKVQASAASAGELESEQVATAERNLVAAENAAVDAVRQAYALSEDAVRNRINDLFILPQSNPQLKFNLPSQKYGNLQIRIHSQRRDLENLFEEWSNSLSSINANNAEDALDDARENLEAVRTFLDDLAEAVNSTPYQADGEIDMWRASVAAARSSVSSAFSGLTAAQQGLQAAELAVATQTAAEGSGEVGRPADIQSAQAQVTQALAGVRIAQASLDKTIFRAPIGGTVNSMNVKRGDVVSGFEEIALVTQEGALEIVAYVSENDAARISPGTAVSIEGVASGSVTRMASALNPTTKKIEVRIAVTEGAEALTNGQSVRLALTTETVAVADDAPLTIPLAALKIQSERKLVYSINAEGTLVAHEVVTGPIVGDRITVVSGIDPDLPIVTDARGLTEGQRVTIAS